MATKRTSGPRPGLIRCEHCGEEYSSSYRRCPFCDEYDEYDACDDDSPRASRGGGKRLAKANRRGGGYGRMSPFRIIGYLFSLAVIVAAIYVVVTVIGPLIHIGDVDQIDPDNPPAGTSDIQPDTSPDSSPVISPDSTEPPAVTGNEPVDPSPDTSPSPSSSASGFTLNESDISFNDQWPAPVTLTATFIPAGTSGTITWSSSNPDYVTVDQDGKVSPGTQRGAATITATLDNGVTQTCIVRNQISSAGASQNTSSGTGSYKLNKTDFTFEQDGETTKLKVKNSSGNEYTGTVTWSSSNTSIASVGSDGTCKAVGNGTCTITATLDNGAKLEAIARVKNQS